MLWCWATNRDMHDLLMLTGCPKCPVFCLSEGIRFYHLCRWGSQDFIICPGFTCMNWLPGLGRCNNKIKRSDGYFTGHRPWLKSDVVAQDGSRLGGEGLKILSSVPGFTCMNWLPGLGRCNNKKRVGWVFYRASPMAQIGCCGSRWLKARNT